ncbi:MAG: M24 family metallopeptidase [Anaerolineae bacterium]|nr:M24 family metallopeptidase [Anaerolineae bacterium]
MQRLSEIQAAICAEGLAGWLLYEFRGLNPIALDVLGIPAARSGSRRWACFIPAQGEPRWLVHAIELGGWQSVVPDALSYVSWADWREGLRAILGGAQRVAMEVSPGAAIPYVGRVDAGTVDLVRSLGVEVVTSADLVQVAQAVWTPEQLASHRRACEGLLAVKDATFAHVRDALVAGGKPTELSVLAFMSEQFELRGLAGAGAIAAVNGHAANPHYFPRPDSDTPLRRGDLLLIDLWARASRPDAIYGDITWTAFAGAEPPARIRQVFEVVRQARDAAVAFMHQRLKTGQAVYGYEVDDVARGVITAAGFGPYFIHRTGHSIGTMGHGNGVNLDNLETQDRRRLIPGVGFSVEPGIYLPEEGFGVRLEIDCYVTENDVEVTTLPLQNELALI